MLHAEKVGVPGDKAGEDGADVVGGGGGLFHFCECTTFPVLSVVNPAHLSLDPVLNISTGS